MMNAEQWFGQAPGGDYQIERSLRFNSSDSAYLSRTPSTAGNRKTWTWAAWVKRSALTGVNTLFGVSGSDDNTFLRLMINGSNIEVDNRTQTVRSTTSVYRDPSAWFHVTWVTNTPAAAESERMQLYVNGVLVSTSNTAVTQNADLGINRTAAHEIGGLPSFSANHHLSGYLADIHFIDGQALTPSSFTEVSATTGQLIPKAYTGSFGTNGFWLKFSDNSAATAATLGKDYSGNGNNWTPNNLSVTAGAGNDSLVDTPTSYGTDDGLGGSVRGNYCTLNPLDTSLTTVADIRQGALEIIPATTYSPLAQGASGTVGVQSGKWYYEGSPVSTSGSGNQSSFGWSQSTSPSGSFYLDTKLKSVGVQCNNNGNVSAFKTEGVSASLANNTSLGLGAVSGDIFQIAVDFDAGKIWIGRNGTWYNSGNPAAGTNATSTFTNSGDTWRPWAETIAFSSHWNKAVVNFGQRPFAYTAPSGFKALCDTNLPAPVVAQPSTVMDVKLYTGNATARSITGLGFSPDFVWIKNRQSIDNHYLYDTLRGATNQISTNTTGVEGTNANGLTAFTSDGFSLGIGSTVNGNTEAFVAWAWDAGSSTVTNTQGSITSQVRANPSAGFSIVTYTGNGTGGATVGHGLGVAPQFVIIKRRSLASNWIVGHSSMGWLSAFEGLNTTDAFRAADAKYWNNTSPTSAVITLGNEGNLNDASQTFVAYCFAPVAGYSSFGSYTGNGSADGPFVYTGFRPRWILLKNSSDAATYNWSIYDASRNTYNVTNLALYPNLPNLETTYSGAVLDLTANGFKLRGADSYVNKSSSTYVWAAFAESPFQYARAR